MNGSLSDQQINRSYLAAKERYASMGIDTEKTLQVLAKIPLSMHCWQGDDVGGFESAEGLTGGGIMATGSYPGKARNGDELRADLEMALKLIPGKHRVNLHAIYAETNGKKIDRADLEPCHFSNGMAWSKEQTIALDYNGSFFSHPMAASGFTLSSLDKLVRGYWIRHGKGSRAIGEALGKNQKSTCYVNLWIPDGYKDNPANRMVHREALLKALDSVFTEKIDPRTMRDAVESKLFGIGSESFVTGSFEFYLGYAVSRKKMLTLDMGHFHPTETIADKISSVLLYIDELLVHVSRGVRWDSDHVVTLSDDLYALAYEMTQKDFLNRVHLALDYFDASINRVAAWVIGAQATQKALLAALLSPRAALREAEQARDFTRRLALFEETRTMPLGAVWDHFCQNHGVPTGTGWLTEVQQYEKNVLSKRI